MNKIWQERSICFSDWKLVMRRNIDGAVDDITKITYTDEFIDNRTDR